jgi:hypothetical protein
MEPIGKCGCGSLASEEEFKRNGNECDECARLRELGNGDILRGQQIDRDEKSRLANKEKFAKIKRTGAKKLKVNFESCVSSVFVSIIPCIGNSVALPVPTETQSLDDNILVNGWRGIVELVAQKTEEETGAFCENAMEMSLSCCFRVKLEGKETAKQAENRIKKSFIKHWQKIVDHVEPGVELQD